MCCPTCLAPVHTDTSCNGICWIDWNLGSLITFQYCPEHAADANLPDQVYIFETELLHETQTNLSAEIEHIETASDDQRIFDWLLALEEAEKQYAEVAAESLTPEIESALLEEISLILEERHRAFTHQGNLDEVITATTPVAEDIDAAEDDELHKDGNSEE